MHGKRREKTPADVEAQRQRDRLVKANKYSMLANALAQQCKESIFDEQLLALSEKLLRVNSEHYTAWNMRRRTIQALFLNTDKPASVKQDFLQTELKLVEECFPTHPKSYWLWNHRRWCVEQMPVPDWKRELELTTTFLKLDSRNFHCWDYRRVVTKKADIPAVDEFNFTTAKIEENFSNYSAWHYRSKLLPIVHPSKTMEVAGRADEQALHEEFELSKNAFFTEPNDQSAWFYQRWLLGRAQPGFCIIQAQVDNGSLLLALSVGESAINATVTTSNQSTPLSGSWQTLSKLSRDECRLWKFMPDDSASITPCSTLQIRLSGADPELFSLEVDQNGHGWHAHSKPTGLSAINFSNRTVLDEELAGYRDLIESDPNCKWPLLSYMQLLHALEPNEHKVEILAAIEKLPQIDPYRRNYYADIGSSLVFEYAAYDLENTGSRECNLSHSKLTRVDHLERFVHVQHLDLSCNLLATLHNVWALQSLQTLILDDNCIEVVPASIADLPQLHSISLKRNRISSREALSALQQVHLLKKVHLTGNLLEITDELRAWFLPKCVIEE